MKQGVILVTGSRDEHSRARIVAGLSQAKRCLEAALPATRTPTRIALFHGAARGADQVAADVARELGWNILDFPANWEEHGRAAGPKRNQHMVDCVLAETGQLGNAQAAVCVAFPLQSSVGTWDCIKRAHSAGIPVWVQPRCHK